MLLTTPVRADDDDPPWPADPRFEGPYETMRSTTEPEAAVVLRAPARPPHAHCAMRGTVTGERESQYLEPVEETRARLLVYEIGFEQAGTPARTQAYFKLKIVRPADGTALRIVRPVVMKGNSQFRFSSADWPTFELDAAGFGGARIDIADLDEVDLFRFAGLGPLGFYIAVTLPEVGFDRAYWVGELTIHRNVPEYRKCICAMESALLREAIEIHCSRLE